MRAALCCLTQHRFQILSIPNPSLGLPPNQKKIALLTSEGQPRHAVSCRMLKKPEKSATAVLIVAPGSHKPDAMNGRRLEPVGADWSFGTVQRGAALKALKTSQTPCHYAWAHTDRPKGRPSTSPFHPIGRALLRSAVSFRIHRPPVGRWVTSPDPSPVASGLTRPGWAAGWEQGN